MVSALVVSASYDKQIRCWDPASGRTVRCFTFQDSQINSLLLVQETHFLVVAGFGVLRLYDISSASSTSAPAGGGGAAPPAGAAGGPAAAGNNAAAAASGGGQAPPLLSSFESPGSMNFTSMGSFPLMPPGGLNSGDESQLTDSSSGGAHALYDPLASTIPTLNTWMNMDGGSATTVIYATSEDGHVRFFDSRSTPVLRVLKDISTGAAITCSCLSPDRSLLLTGNQMGIVSVWHVPSIRDSVAVEQQQGQAEEEHVRAAAAAFGSLPLQEISFPGDYTAIRSIVVEPLGRWAVVATNAGNLHFLRFAHDSKLFGSKSANAQPWGSAAAAAAAAAAVGHPETSARDETASSSNRRANEAASDASSNVPRESIYRSALVVNELSVEHARRTSSGGTESLPISGTTGRPSPRPGGGIGTVLLDSIEHRHLNSLAASTEHQANPSSAAAAAGDQLNVAVAAATSSSKERRSSALQEEFEMEVFHSFQAHYKYILKVAISPNGELLTTCSADYTIGRFQVPAALQVTTALNAREEAAHHAMMLLGSDERAAPLHGTSACSITTPRNASTASTQAPAMLRPQEGTITTAPIGHVVPPAAVVIPVGTRPHADKQTATADGGVNAAESEEGVGSTTPVQPGGGAPESLSSSVHHLDMEHAGQPSGADGSEHADSVAAAAKADTVISAASLVYFKPLKPLIGHNRWVWDCVFSDCSRYLFSASSDSHIKMWHGLTSDRPQSTSFVGHTKPVVAVLLYYDRRR